MEGRWPVTYQVYCDGSKIYEHGVDDLKITTPVLELEMGKSGAFQFTIYPNHPNYVAVAPMAKVTVDRKGKNIYTGRILSIKYGFYNEKQVSCEGELAFLLDVLIEPHTYTGSFVGYLSYILGLYNARVETTKRFVRGSATVAEYAPYTTSEKDYQTAFDLLTNKLVTPSGGYLQVRNVDGTRYLDLLSYQVDGTASTQSIEFGTNLLNLTQEFKGEGIFSAIIPLGAKISGTETRLDIKSVNGGVGFLVNAEAQKLCKGTIYRQVIFDGLTNAQTLKAQAETYLAENYAGEQSIEVTAADLAGIDTSLDFFEVGQWVRVYSQHHFAVNPQLFMIKKLTINLLSPAENKIVIGKVKKGFTEAVAEIASSVNSISVPEAVQPYVMESGSTGIWTWKKFSDNTCEFFGKVPITSADVTSALGNWYRGVTLYEATAYEYPFEMTEAPALEMTFQTRNGLAALLWISSIDAETAQRYLPQSFLIRPTTATGIFGNINIIAKGKLKT